MSSRTSIRESADTLKTIRDDLKIIGAGALWPLARSAFEACSGSDWANLLRVNPLGISFRVIKPSDSLLVYRQITNVKRNGSFATPSFVQMATKDFINNCSSGKSVIASHIVSAKNVSCGWGTDASSFWSNQSTITADVRLDSMRRFVPLVRQHKWALS